MNSFKYLKIGSNNKHYQQALVPLSIWDKYQYLGWFEQRV